MSDGGRRDLLSIGVFLIVVVVSILLYQPLQVITDWTLILPLILLLSGCWFIVLAGMQSANPQKYALGPFTILSWGVLLAAIGGAWFLFSYGWYYSIAVVLVALAAVAVAAGLKRK
jgi:hypothetical protein